MRLPLYKQVNYIQGTKPGMWAVYLQASEHISFEMLLYDATKRSRSRAVMAEYQSPSGDWR